MKIHFSEEAKQKLLKVKQHILEDPRRLSMGTWVDRASTLSRSEEKIPPCGTVACIAGWTTLLFDKKRRSSTNPDYQAIALETLGITPSLLDKSFPLFYSIMWPVHLHHAWAVANTLKKEAAVAAEAIDYYIENGVELEG